jgi:hypothetical protein
MGFHHTATFSRGTRISHDKTELFLPPSMMHRGENSSTGTTIPVNQPPKDPSIVNPSWRHVTKVRLVESSNATKVDCKDKYFVPEQNEEREQPAENHTPLPESKWLAKTSDSPIGRPLSSTNAVKLHEKQVVHHFPAVDSFELVSLPPSIRKHKKNKLFSKLKKGKTRASSRLDLASFVPRLGTTSANQEEGEEEGTVEVRLLAWTDYKLTVQIFDGQTKTKIQFKRDQEIEVKLPKIAIFPYEGRADENDHVKGIAEILEQDNDDETMGPDDIPCEVSYRTMPSISSIVFHEIPPAVSIPDVSDISSNSSDASDSTESDTEEDFFCVSNSKEVSEETEETKAPAMVAGKVKKWNKRIFSGLKRRSSAE